MAHLVITSGPNKGNNYPLGNRTITVGRDPARDIQLLDEKVGRRHFQIRKEGESYTVLDLRSKNGTFVNGVRAEEKPLRHGDVIQAGNTQLTFYEEDAPDRTDAFQKHKQASPEAREFRTVIEPKFPS